MGKLNNQLPQVPDNPWKDLQFRFDGRWMPDIDPALIGPNNYAELKNLRYKDSGLEGVNGYTLVNNAVALDGSDATLGNFPKIRTGHQLRSNRTQKTYTLVQALNASNQGRVFVNRTTIGSQGSFDNSSDFDISGNPYYADSVSGLTGRFSDAPRGNIVYANGYETMIFAGDEQNVAAVFSVDDAGSSPGYLPANAIDYTEEISDNLVDNYLTISTAGKPNILIMTTRPVQSFKFYIDPSNANDQTDATLTCKYWTGTVWSSNIISSDGTVSGGATLAQTGVIKFSAHTKTTVKLKHYEELYLYAYLFQLTESVGTDATARIYGITADKAFQTLENVWDGVYRQPVQVQVYANASTSYSDYTAQANVASEEDNPVGMKISGLTSSDHIILMFPEQMAGIRFQMLGGLVNKAGGIMSVSYWNGSAYTAVGTKVDETNNFAQTGLVNWIPNSAEKPRTLFNTFGYAYKITTDTTLTSSPNVYADIITGIPATKSMGGYDFSVNYGTRLMLCSPSIENEGNRMDYSVANAPDVFNGSDSSDNGKNSLYFGGEGNITSAAPLYNRFGSNIYSMLLVTKDSETYLLVGDTPDEFTIYPVSRSIGNPAPETMATGEVNVGEKPTEGTTRNIAIWLSSSGPVMFDGASISSIRGIENYFDPNNDEYIEWDYVTNARGWMDNVYKEYNLLIPSSSGQVLNNKWLVYDLLRKKWFEKTTGSASFPQSSFEVLDTNGERKNYGGIDTGYMIYLENGTSWNGTGITQRVKTGDFYPNETMWDITTIRKFKLLVHKFDSVTANTTLQIYYYRNTEGVVGSGISFVNTDDGVTGVTVDFEDTDYVEWASTASVSIDVYQNVGTNRILNIVQDENRKGWIHAYAFEVTTSSVSKGFRPIAWGVQYRVERKDNKSTD